jgi:hypothetical protein
MLEQEILSSDASNAIIHVVAFASGSCTTGVAGGALTVTPPAGSKVMYVNASGQPSASQTSFAALADGKPVADLYDVTPGAPVQLEVSHPTCKQAGRPQRGARHPPPVSASIRGAPPRKGRSARPELLDEERACVGELVDALVERRPDAVPRVGAGAQQHGVARGRGGLDSRRRASGTARRAGRSRRSS